MSAIEFQTRPIEQWPGKLTAKRVSSPFRSGWGDTIKLLNRELAHLQAKAVVLLMPLEPGEIRNDGRPRADARPKHPGVILSFESRGKPMQFPCDRYLTWSDNVRAIALALEALRKVDRYGVTQHGEQYKGWQALPPPAAPTEFAGQVDALRWIANLTSISIATLSSRESVDRALRQAEMQTHPDGGGNAADFKRVQAARKMLLG